MRAFSIGASDGVLRYIGSGDEDVARTPSYTLTVTAIAGAWSATAAVQVGSGICTQQVRDEIVGVIYRVSNCGRCDARGFERPYCEVVSTQPCYHGIAERGFCRADQLAKFRFGRGTN